MSLLVELLSINRSNRCRATAKVLVILFAVIWIMPGSQVRANELPKLLLFPMELQDTSHEGELDGIREDQQRRLKLLDEEAVALFSETGRYELVDWSPFAARIEEFSPLRNCNGCDIDMAKEAGADYSVLGVVYKVSNLILEIHLYLRDVKTGQVINHMHTNIRGNTDRSWLRGLRWLMKNRLKPHN